MDMNSPKGKEILALVRNGDYAHAGEEEAIELAFRNMPKDPGRLLLDVGCGRGQTAQYVQHKGWGNVLGVDIDRESIDYAKKKYDAVEFMAADAISLSESISRRFDMIYLFNSFYAFSDHARVLDQLRALIKPAGQLMIFDYSIKSANRKDLPFKDWNPLEPSDTKRSFPAAGWDVTKVDDISGLYKKWYENLTSRIAQRSAQITASAGKEWFDFVASFYRNILVAIEKGLLGGAILYAVARDRQTAV
jgi:ubiquinone/menaquinone biosynthesis C-methylase UbiE